MAAGLGTETRESNENMSPDFICQGAFITPTIHKLMQNIFMLLLIHYCFLNNIHTNILTGCFVW